METLIQTGSDHKTSISRQEKLKRYIGNSVWRFSDLLLEGKDVETGPTEVADIIGVSKELVLEAASELQDLGVLTVKEGKFQRPEQFLEFGPQNLAAPDLIETQVLNGMQILSRLKESQKGKFYTLFLKSNEKAYSKFCAAVKEAFENFVRESKDQDNTTAVGVSLNCINLEDSATEGGN